MRKALPRCSTSTTPAAAKRPAWPRKALFLGIAVGVALAPQAIAQPSGSRPALEEIVVTATRREQSQQDIALSVTPITGEQLDKLKIFKFEDIKSLNPGMDLSDTPRNGPSISMRGIGFSSFSSAPPAVDVYFNELPLNAIFAFNSIFDVQQIEILRGPQGTLRGKPAPAGAITVVTRRPDLQEIGGTVSAAASDADAQNYQGAFNLPVLADKLAVRVAGLKDSNELPGGRSVSSGDEPDTNTEALRGSVLFEPGENLSFLLSHNYLKRETKRFDILDGPGSGYNGPAIDAQDRKGVAEVSSEGNQKVNVTSLLANWEFDSARLVYVGGYQALHALSGANGKSDQDQGNAIVDYAPTSHNDIDFHVTSHELRLQSTGAERSWDYTVGLWYEDTDTHTRVKTGSALGGAFGLPAVPRGPANKRYLLGVNVDIPTKAENTAIFANGVFHVTDATDISVGARYFKEKSDRSQTLSFVPGYNAIPGIPAFACPDLLNTLGIAGGGWAASQYAGACDLRIAPPSFFQPQEEEWTDWVYNASVSHHFSDDVMAYLTFAHSWRPPGVTVAITSPVPDDLIFGEPEKSDSIELGLKSELADGRVRLNAALFYQEFQGFIGRFEGVPYLNTVTNLVQDGGFTYNADAIVSGAEADVLVAIAENWTAQLTASVQDGHYDDAQVPCRDTDVNGTPDGGPNPAPAAWGAPGPVAFCESDDSISTLPDWSATLQSEYFMQRGTMEYYVRGLYSYQPDNKNVQTYFERDAYGILNLYLGVRAADGGWDLSLWAKNLLDDDTVLDQYTFGNYAGFPSGYRTVLVQPEREIGLSLRYSFGEG